MKYDLHAGMQGIHNIVLCDDVDTLQKYVVGNLAIFNQGSTILCDDVDTLLEKSRVSTKAQRTATTTLHNTAKVK